MIPTGLAHSRDTPRANRTRHNTHGPERVESTPLKILAGDIFQRLPPGPQVDPVPYFRISRNCADLRIEEMRHQAADGIRRNDGIGIDTDEDFFIAQVLQAKVQSIGFAGVGLGQDQHLAGCFFASKRPPRYFQCFVLRAVINDDDPQVGIIRIERRLHRALDDLLFVISGDQHRNLWPVRRSLAGGSVDTGAHAIVDGKSSDGEQPAGHEQIAYEEDQGNRSYADVKQPEAHPIQTRCPALVGGHGWHDIGASFTEQLVDGNNLKAACACAFDDHRQRAHGLATIATSIV